MPGPRLGRKNKTEGTRAGREAEAQAEAEAEQDGDGQAVAVADEHQRDKRETREAVSEGSQGQGQGDLCLWARIQGYQKHPSGQSSPSPPPDMICFFPSIFPDRR